MHNQKGNTFVRFWPRPMVQNQLVYGPGPNGPGSLIIWKNIQSQICSRIIFEMHTAPGACSKYAPGVVCIQTMLLEHIWLRIFFQIIWSRSSWSWTIISQGQNLTKARGTGGGGGGGDWVEEFVFLLVPSSSPQIELTPYRLYEDHFLSSL